MEDSILILNAIPENLQTEDELRGFRETASRVLGYSSAPMDVVAESAGHFFENVSALFDKVEGSLAGFQLDEIEVTAGLTTSGKFVLVVGEIGGGFEGGIKFKFKRRNVLETDRENRANLSE